MPLYEYRCEQDGTLLELLRPMAEADAPVEDPEGRGRTFRRVHSLFAAKGAGPAGQASSGGHTHHGGSCACGKRPAGQCGGG